MTVRLRMPWPRSARTAAEPATNSQSRPTTGMPPAKGALSLQRAPRTAYL